MTWNFERTASIARERCGGQGYLLCNELPLGVGFAHAGMTAEGDNSVLMQKVKLNPPLILCINIYSYFYHY